MTFQHTVFPSRSNSSASLASIEATHDEEHPPNVETLKVAASVDTSMPGSEVGRIEGPINQIDELNVTTSPPIVKV